MWSSDLRPGLQLLARVAAVAALGALTAGCFQPMYGDAKVVPTAGLDDKMSAVDVQEIITPQGSRIARVGVEVRNALIFNTTGGSGQAAPAYALQIVLAASQTQVLVDITSGRPDVQNYGIDATYTLIDLATKKPVVRGQTFARVSYNIPGQQQRFAGDRGMRDAENRAAKVIAENIRNRLASYFVAGA